MEYRVVDANSEYYSIRCDISANGMSSNWARIMETPDELVRPYFAIMYRMDANTYLVVGERREESVFSNDSFSYATYYDTVPNMPTDCVLQTYFHKEETDDYRISYLLADDWKEGNLGFIIIQYSNYQVDSCSLNVVTNQPITEVVNGNMELLSDGSYNNTNLGCIEDATDRIEVIELKFEDKVTNETVVNIQVTNM